MRKTYKTKSTFQIVEASIGRATIQRIWKTENCGKKREAFQALSQPRPCSKSVSKLFLQIPVLITFPFALGHSKAWSNGGESWNNWTWIWRNFDCQLSAEALRCSMQLIMTIWKSLEGGSRSQGAKKCPQRKEGWSKVKVRCSVHEPSVLPFFKRRDALT